MHAKSGKSRCGYLLGSFCMLDPLSLHSECSCFQGLLPPKVLLCDSLNEDRPSAPCCNQNLIQIPCPCIIGLKELCTTLSTYPIIYPSISIPLSEIYVTPPCFSLHQHLSFMLLESFVRPIKTHLCLMLNANTNASIWSILY